MGRKNRKSKPSGSCCEKIDYELVKLWQKIEAELAAAMVVLMQDQPNPSLEAKYQEYLGHNEFELAYQVLKKLGEGEEQLPDFHEHLTAAAKLMKLANA